MKNRKTSNMREQIRNLKIIDNLIRKLQIKTAVNKEIPPSLSPKDKGPNRQRDTFVRPTIRSVPHPKAKTSERRKRKAWGKKQQQVMAGEGIQLQSCDINDVLISKMVSMFQVIQISTLPNYEDKTGHFNQAETQAYNSQAQCLKII